MAKKKKNGLHIGNYVIRPLGLTIIGLLLVALIVVGTLIIARSISGGPDQSAPEPTRQVITLTPTPTAEPEETPAASATPTPSPSPSPTPALRSATIRSLGEIVVQQNVLNAARTETSYDFSPMFEYIGDVVGNADWTVGDVEGPMDNRPDSAYSGNDPFNTPPQIMLAMKAAGVDMLTLANGQTLDMLFEGMQQTIANCKTAEMDYIGAFASEEEFETPKIVDVNGINVGFLNYTTSMGGMEEQSKAEAMTYGVATTANTSPSEDVKKAKEAGADVVVAYISWGQVGVRELGESEFNAATALAQAAWTCSSASIRTPSSRRAGSMCNLRTAPATACSACAPRATSSLISAISTRATASSLSSPSRRLPRANSRSPIRPTFPPMCGAMRPRTAMATSTACWPLANG